MTGAFAAAAARFQPPKQRPWRFQARPEQLSPPGDWSVWLLLAGRGFGKSRSGAEWLLEQAQAHAGTDWAVVAPTFGSARDVCAEGPSGLLRCALPGEVTHYVRSLGEVRLSSGSRIYLRSADEPDRLRGLNLAGAWCDELAVWRYEQTWYEGLVPAVRLDPARFVVTTTPRPTKLLRSLVDRKDGSVALTRGSTFDNAANLSATALAELQTRYEGTRLGRQELGGEMLEDREGALWTLDLVNSARVDEAPQLDRVVVGVDPAVSSNSGSDETGIVVVGIAGRGPTAQFYVLADASRRATPQAWSNAVAAMFARFSADNVIAEVNQGGDLVEQTLRNAAPDLPVRKVRATRGKALRAEPVAALYEQGRVHHVGMLTELEDQMTTWVPGQGASPDRVDALVWAVSGLTSSGARRVVYLDDQPREGIPLPNNPWPVGPGFGPIRPW